jgi:hypothetical protein
MASLFEQIAGEHAVPVRQVSGALGRNRGYIDAGVNLPFALFYCVASLVVARWVWRKYPPVGYGWIPGAVIALFLSLAMAAASAMLGDLWSWFIEGLRVGNDHMSYRVERLWRVRNRTGLRMRRGDRLAGHGSCRTEPGLVLFVM